MTYRFLTVNMMSEMTGIDRRTIRKRIEGLQGQKGAKNGTYYDAYEALPRLYHPDGKSHGDIALSMRNETLLLERAKRERLDIDIKRLRGEYVSVEEVAKTVEKEYSFVRAQLRSLGSKLAKPLALIMDPHEVQIRIDESINECLTELVADEKYEEAKNELEQARIEIEESKADDDEADSEDESGGMGRPVSLPVTRE